MLYKTRFLFLVFLLLLCACQPTPEEEYVVNRGDHKIEEQIEFSLTNKALVNMFTLQKSLTYYENATNANLLLMLKLRSDARKIGFNEEEIAAINGKIQELLRMKRRGEDILKTLT